MIRHRTVTRKWKTIVKTYTTFSVNAFLCEDTESNFRFKKNQFEYQFEIWQTDEIESIRMAKLHNTIFH